MGEQSRIKEKNDAGHTETDASPGGDLSTSSPEFQKNAGSEIGSADDASAHQKSSAGGESNTTDVEQAQSQAPPTEVDGGFGWICVICVFLINAHTWGINSVSLCDAQTPCQPADALQSTSLMAFFWLTIWQPTHFQAHQTLTMPLLGVFPSVWPNSLPPSQLSPLESGAQGPA